MPRVAKATNCNKSEGAGPRESDNSLVRQKEIRRRCAGPRGSEKRGRCRAPKATTVEGGGAAMMDERLKFWVATKPKKVEKPSRQRESRGTRERSYQK